MTTIGRWLAGKHLTALNIHITRGSHLDFNTYLSGMQLPTDSISAYRLLVRTPPFNRGAEYTHGGTISEREHSPGTGSKKMTGKKLAELPVHFSITSHCEAIRSTLECIPHPTPILGCIKKHHVLYTWLRSKYNLKSIGIRGSVSLSTMYCPSEYEHELALAVEHVWYELKF